MCAISSAATLAGSATLEVHGLVPVDAGRSSITVSLANKRVADGLELLARSG